MSTIDGQTLVNPFSSSRIEISKSALQSNLTFLRDVVGEGPIICSVVKGNAYGHGIEQYVPLAESCGIRWFGVYSADEALRVYNCRTKDSTIMVMGGLTDEQIAWAVEHDVTFHVFNLHALSDALTTAKTMKRRARVHLELETGMNRFGFETAGMEEVVALLRQYEPFVEVMGVCTHFAGAESVANHLRIQSQIKIFETQFEWLKSQGITPKLKHAASSAATFSYPSTRYDMVRVGIAQYGFWPSLETRMQYVLQESNGGEQITRDPINRILSWKTEVINVKQVLAGKFVGYGTTYMTTRQSLMAAIPVGYYHGFNRNLSNTGHVLIRGKRAQVAGVVNMNMMLVDVTDIRGVETGDEVVMIGKQGRSEITIGAFSDLTKLLNYEALVRLTPDITRVVVA